MAEDKICHSRECRNCNSVTRKIKYGDYLYKGKTTLSKRQCYKPCFGEVKDMYENDDHSVPLSDLLKRLDTNTEKGLHEEQVIALKERFGLNVISFPKTNKWQLIRRSLRGSFFFEILAIIMCFVVAVLPSYDSTPPYDAYYICLACIIIITTVVLTIISFRQEKQSVDVMNSFRHLYPYYASVIRDGNVSTVHQSDIVIGDLVLLKAGNRVPADIRITKACNLYVNDLPLICKPGPAVKTSECTSQNSAVTQNMAFFGTLCTEGYGQGIAIRTGDNTTYAKMMRKTVLLQEMNTEFYKLVKKIFRIVGLFTSIAGIILFTFNLKHSWMTNHSWTSVFILVLVQIIASMPNILYSIITACLSFSAQKMAYNSCLPKHYEAVETLGAITTICCHKTGILTQNRMTVTALWLEGKVINVEPSLNRSRMTLDWRPTQSTWEACIIALCLCSSIASKSRRNRCIIHKHCSCDQTEVAIMEFVNYVSQDGNVSSRFVDNTRADYEKIFEIPFNSYSKYQVTVHDKMHSLDSQGCDILVCMKGAVDIIINFCSTVLVHGREEPVSFLEDLNFQEAFEDLMAQGDRVIGFCDYSLPSKQFDHDHVFREADVPSSGFRFLGFIAIMDPPRASVANDIAYCKSAGIRVILITKDHPITAKAIAKKVGIISRNSETRDEIAERFHITPQQVTPGSANAVVITGSELRLMDKEELWHLLKEYQETVFARIEPSQKLDILMSLQKYGNVVAATGNCLDDCLTMDKAHIGVGMGMQSCDASRDSSDIILLGDNFSSLVMGIREGRVIYDNVKKAIVFVMSSNLPEVSLLLVATVFGFPMPIGPILIILITLIVELVFVLVLAQEKAEDNIMHRDPPESTGIFSYKLVHKACFQIGLVGSLSGLYVYFLILAQHGFMPYQVIGIKKQWDSVAINDLKDSFNQEWSYRSRKNLEFTCQTAFFVTLIVLLWFIVGLSRTPRKSVMQCNLKILQLIAIFFLQSVVVLFLMYTPVLSAALHVSPPEYTWWLVGTAFGVFLLIWDEVLKFITRHSKKNSWLDKEAY